MDEWDAERFYEQNAQSEASFLIATRPMHTDLRDPLALVLSQILHDEIGRYGFIAVVHTPDGDRSLTLDEYADLLRIQERLEEKQAAEIKARE